MNYNKQFRFENPIHPWGTLKEFLEEYQMTQKELSERIGMTEKHISWVINGKENISLEMASKLETIFKISSTFWNNLQMSYNEDILRIQDKEKQKEEYHLIKDYQYWVLKKLGFVEDTNDKARRVSSLRSFFSVSSLFDIPNISNNAFAFRKYEKFNNKEKSFQSWLRVWEVIWDNISIREFSKPKLNEILPEIKKLTREEVIDIKRLENIFSEVGIYFVFVPWFPNSPVAWLTRKYKKNPMIQISDRWKKNDIFWFTLAHEMGHILHHYSPENTLFIDYEWKGIDDMERDADNFAQIFLIDDKFYKAEVKKDKIDIWKIAKISETSISVVAWRICHDFGIKNKNIWAMANPFRTPIQLENLQY